MAGADVDLQITTDSAGNGSRISIRGIINHIHEDGGKIVAIGKKSHDENISLRDQHGKFEGNYFNWIVSLYITRDYTEIDKVCDTAKQCVREVTRETPTDHDGGLDQDKKKHHVFALVHRHVRYEKNCSDRYKRSASQYIRNNPNSEFYIGITSGSDAISAMIKRRTGDKYKDMHGINRMIAIFTSKDQDECRRVEAELVEHYEENENNLNRVGGGGGRRTTQPWSFVYLGMHVGRDWLER